MPKPLAKTAKFTKVTKESLVDAPDAEWVDRLIEPVNRLLDADAQAKDGNLTFTGNLNSEVVEINVRTVDPRYFIFDKHVQTTDLSDRWSGDPTYEKSYIIKHPDQTVELYLAMDDFGIAPTVYTNLFTTGLPDEFRPPRALLISGNKFDYTSNPPLTWDASPFILFPDGNLQYCGNALTSHVYVAHIRYLPLSPKQVPLSCWPLTAKTRFTTPPIGVIVLSVEDAEPGGAQMVLPGSLGVVWSYTKAGEYPQIRIENIANLPYNRSFKIKLLIMGK